MGLGAGMLEEVRGEAAGEVRPCRPRCHLFSGAVEDHGTTWGGVVAGDAKQPSVKEVSR